MFLGHFAVAFATKRFAPKTSLWLLMFAAQFLDILWAVLVIFDAEHLRISPGITRVCPIDFYDFPLSHSLPMVLTWGVGFGLIYFMATNQVKVSWILGGLVVSNWILDVVVHRPDLLVFGEGRYWGLGLWNSLPGTLLVEGGLFAAGVWIYRISTKAKDEAGQFGFYGLIVFILALYIAPFLFPLPSNPLVVAFAAQVILIVLLWAFWLDDHRKAA
jgi:hypothetical protein